MIEAREVVSGVISSLKGGPAHLSRRQRCPRCPIYKYDEEKGRVAQLPEFAWLTFDIRGYAIQRSGAWGDCRADRTMIRSAGL